MPKCEICGIEIIYPKCELCGQEIVFLANEPYNLMPVNVDNICEISKFSDSNQNKSHSSICPVFRFTYDFNPDIHKSHFLVCPVTKNKMMAICDYGKYFIFYDTYQEYLDSIVHVENKPTSRKKIVLEEIRSASSYSIPQKQEFHKKEIEKPKSRDYAQTVTSDVKKKSLKWGKLVFFNFPLQHYMNETYY